MNTFEPLPARTLVRVAHHERPGDAPGVACVASVLAIAYEMQAGLRQRLEPMALTGHKFAVLMVLYAVDPIPTTVSDLAFHARLKRTTTSILVGQLQSTAWVIRRCDPADRRAVSVQLTKQGRTIAHRALHEALRLFAELGRGIDAAAQVTVTNACGTLRENLPSVLPTPGLLAPSSS